MIETCINRTEAEERSHLDYVRTTLGQEQDRLGGAVSLQFSDVIEMKKYLQESKADMDHAEKASVRQSIDQMGRIGEHNMARAQQLAKLRQRPYFGRIDFVRRDEEGIEPVYIGMHSFHDSDQDVHLTYDWRAPISSMFYDFELGDAFFEAPAGRIEGEVMLKRQYRIKDGELIFMLETSLNIQDEILQQELSRASDNRMRNIVATIQRDQNAIIRNDRTHALVIQGAAGSGKTSIALHRIAFLLYKFKDSITSDEILIISPNKVFAHYISQVLPELGEQMIQETTMETLANYLLDYSVKFQTFSEQVSMLLEARDSGYAERIRFKAGCDFLSLLNRYAAYVRKTNVHPTDVRIGRHIVEADWIAQRFKLCGIMAYAEQINEVTDAVVSQILRMHRMEIAGKQRSQVRSQLQKMIVCKNVQTLYKDFYSWLGQPEMFKKRKGGVCEYSDVFPLIYLKMLLEGTKPHDKIKHLVIDEMQDYTPVQYQVIATLFRCPKTILGDYNQAVNPLSASAAETIGEVLPRAECMYMNKSYRSTLQITELAQRIHCNENLVPVARHGEEPDIVACAHEDEEIERIGTCVGDFLGSDYNSLGIICKTQHQVNELHARLRKLHPGIRRIDTDSIAFSAGVIIATAHLAKGLEFDQVIIPFAGAENYQNLIDRHMLYVACTRAMHKLSLTHTGKLTEFLLPDRRSGAS